MRGWESLNLDAKAGHPCSWASAHWEVCCSHVHLEKLKYQEKDDVC
jgi:hypothetical protein